MLYHSTRNPSLTADSAQAVLEGLAPDGGLYMPSALPAFDWKACLQGDSQAMASAILSALLPDIPDMDTLVRRAYTGKFQTEDLTPPVKAGPVRGLELCRGPPSAAWGRVCHPQQRRCPARRPPMTRRCAVAPAGAPDLWRDLSGC